MGQNAGYSGSVDYRITEPTDADAPFYGAAAAARVLGYSSSQSVVNLIKSGKLPARRTQGRRPVWEIPSWAVLGRAAMRVLPPTAGEAELATLRMDVQRLRGVTDAFMRAAEHEERAEAALQTYAFEKALAALAYKQAVTSQLVPDFPPTAGGN